MLRSPRYETRGRITVLPKADDSGSALTGYENSLLYSIFNRLPGMGSDVLTGRRHGRGV